MSSPPINHGWIRLSGDEVLEVGRGRPPGKAVDLGDVAVLPALVNAHTHLEFSDLVHPIGSRGIPLHDWIGRVITARGELATESKQAAITRGLEESHRAGVRLVGEITTPPAVYQSDDSTPAVISFAEVIGLDEARGEERLRASLEHHAVSPQAGWSPHAPYSTRWELIEFCASAANRTKRPLAMHVAESAAERELLESASGPLVERLRELGVWREGLFPWPGDSFVTLIERLTVAPRVLLVHGNDLRDREIETIAQHPHVTIVYCPRTHAFFEHPKHPVERMLSAGIRVALGTDSRASNPDLQLWKEAQWILEKRPEIDPMQVVAMATQAGADALGRRDLGRIEAGASPGLLALRTTAQSLDSVAASLTTDQPRWIASVETS